MHAFTSPFAEEWIFCIHESSFMQDQYFQQKAPSPSSIGSSSNVLGM